MVSLQGFLDFLKRIISDIIKVWVLERVTHKQAGGLTVSFVKWDGYTEKCPAPKKAEVGREIRESLPRHRVGLPGTTSPWPLQR
jgi:hypothetical protein